MDIQTNVLNGGRMLVIKVGEKFDFSKVQDFRDAYAGLDDHIDTVEVDLALTDYMDSSALGMLLNMQKNLGTRIQSYRITHCRPQVARILKISRFDKKFDIS